MIARSNVYKFDGAEKFEETLSHLRSIIKEVEGPDIHEKIEHFLMLSRFFIFNIDPEAEDLEAEKSLVQEESKKV